MFNLTKHMNELKTYTCQFCKQSYQSDGERKPKSFRKDGSVYQYYDSTLFCSKECCKEYITKKRLQILKNNPKIWKKAIEKIKQTYKNNPDILKERTKRRLQTYKNNPEIMKKLIKKRKQTLKNNPDIMKKSVEKRKQTYLRHPEIQKNAMKKYKQTLKNNPEILERRIQKLNSDEVKNKIIFTKRKNNTFNTSKPEDQLYSLLKIEYPDTLRQYKDSRYPYCCDFYIPSLDLFIEFQGSWTHGPKPFIEDDIECQNQLNSWNQRSTSSEFYKNAIKTWTIRDVNKRNIAKQNHLNYIEVFSLDFKELYDRDVLMNKNERTIK